MTDGGHDRRRLLSDHKVGTVMPTCSRIRHTATDSRDRRSWSYPTQNLAQLSTPLGAPLVRPGSGARPRPRACDTLRLNQKLGTPTVPAASPWTPNNTEQEASSDV